MKKQEKGQMRPSKSQTNTSKIMISLKKAEREAIKEEAEKRGLAASTLCAEIIRERIRYRPNGKAYIKAMKSKPTTAK